MHWLHVVRWWFLGYPPVGRKGQFIWWSCGSPCLWGRIFTSNTLWAGELNLLFIPIICMSCIGIVMPKSQKVVGASFIDGVVGLDFNAWDYMVIVEGVRIFFRDVWCTWVPIQMPAWVDEVSSLGAPNRPIGFKPGSESQEGWLESTCAS